jgi:sugar transferase (PEP-CTERM/EpsH1 system associated)
MEILVFAPYAPYPPRFGGAARMFHLIRGLARDHRVTLLCFASAEEAGAIGPIREICAAVHIVEPPSGASWKRFYQLRSVLERRAYGYHAYYSVEMASRLAALLANRRFDVVQVEFGNIASYYALPDTVLRVVDEHNVEYLLLERTSRQEANPLRRLYNRLQAEWLRRDELTACRRSDGILTTSAVDRAVLAQDVADVPIRVVPNGVDTDFFTPGKDPVDPNQIVFTGAIDYRPNTDGVLYFCSEILPRIHVVEPKATFAIVGRNPPRQVRRLTDRVLVTGTIPDVRPWMRKAAVFVVPLRVGSGTRLKILEAMATGCAVVSTSLGCEGLEVTPEGDILIGDTPEAFAEQVVRCLRDPDLRARLGAQGRALVERRYRWEPIGEELAAFYQELRKARRAVRRTSEPTTIA